MKKKFIEVNDKLKEKLVELNKLNEELKKHKLEVKELKERDEKEMLKSKEAEVQNKLKQGKKLTTEDILVMQKMEEIK